MDIATLAPDFHAAGITEQQAIDRIDALPADPEKPAEPEITKAKLANFWNLLTDGKNGLAKHGGIVQLSNTCGFSAAQGRRFLVQAKALIAARRAELNPGVEE